MNNLELILESINSKASEEKNQILEAAQAEAKKIIEDSQKESKAEIDKIIEDAKKEAALIESNEALSSSRKARDIKIAAKNELIDRVLEKVYHSLKNLDRPQYKKFVTNRLKDFPNKNAQILLKEGMEYAFESGDLGGLSVSNETVDDGFLIKDGKVIYDNSFSSIIDYEKDDLKRIISKELFSEGTI
uniref:V-type ATP synthase subunit E n=1 Tax=Anaerococcus mediterraneensis TaxID=1870984 RepID=UPI000931E834|nr:V-type ATP synthase subunit E [Anaerococcus mediterraneensis]